ncbi:DJ-1/PfpI family protein [Pseudodesulfovibrio sediminis]|uniref:Glutamine amidotransferase n=1 Tax=Pseudodesulfovibrio sediminis TaxID=2810563 RepID=A0ABM9SDT7_9BACT|nr:DJ-1/PfpI family protein [Pseudodesulfovibrio sediminis]BCS88675.1 glutamine amidotransferase [Pseudodesulfovibrio sediminis]
MMAKIAIILTPHFADWEYALIAGTGRPFYGLDVQFFTPAPGELQSLGGLTVRVPQGLEAMNQWAPEVVVVIGGTLWESEDAPDIGEVLRAHHARGAVVAGICGGTLALARAGMLDAIPHTSNEAEYLTLNAQEYTGAEHFCPSATAVSTDRVITAPGVAPVSFTAAIFESIGLDQNTVLQFKNMLAAEHN